MILDLESMRQRRLSKGFRKTAARIITEAAITPLDKEWDVFLSYSSRDAYALSDVLERLYEEGLSVYVDAMADADLDPRRVTAATADRLRVRLEHSRALFVLTSANTTASRWVPWELGFADGAGKGVAIFPFRDREPPAIRFSGSEYFGLYPWLDDVTDTNDVPYLWPTDADDPTFYARIDHWLADGQLDVHRK